MKFLLISLGFFGVFVSCNNDVKEDHSKHETSKTAETITPPGAETKIVKPVFGNLDATVGAHIKELFDHYIHVKTALVNSDAAEAKNAANALSQVITAFDKSLLPVEQKKAYDKNIKGIAASANNIATGSELEKQREYFAALSNEAYELAKSFGAGKTVYHDHCPMAFNDKGAMWLSESKDINNPYFGEKMPGCGTVEEFIEK